MAGFDLIEGRFDNRIVSEEELWMAFNNVFSTKTVNVSSYKFVFLKSIIDCMKYANQNLQLSFEQIFTRFTEIYWILVVKYEMIQGVSNKNKTHVEQVLCHYIENNYSQERVEYCDLPDRVRSSLVRKVVSSCKRYVVGALYEDTHKLFYSFSKKEEWIKINPQTYKFLRKHKNSIEELNYYELSKFLVSVNEKGVMTNSKKIFSHDMEDRISVYRKIISEEFEKSEVS